MATSVAHVVMEQIVICQTRNTEGASCEKPRLKRQTSTASAEAWAGGGGSIKIFPTVLIAHNQFHMCVIGSLL